MNPKEFYFEENCFITELLNNPLDPAVSVARVRVLPHETTKWHHLEGITERYLILEGIGLAEVGDDQSYPVVSGDAVVISPDIRQRITNTGHGDLLFLAVCTPRFENGQYRAH